jgi:hypothetical protein
MMSAAGGGMVTGAKAATESARRLVPVDVHESVTAPGGVVSRVSRVLPAAAWLTPELLT